MIFFNFKPKRTGLALPALQAPLAAARAITSHFRKRFEERYRKKYRQAHLLFIFDAVLLFLAVGLLIFDFVVLTRPVVQPPLDLRLKTNELVGAAPQPVEVVVRSTDGAVHNNVKLTWHLPPWVQIVRADPALNESRAAVLGELKPGEDKRSRLYVVIRATPGTEVPFRFSLQEGEGRGVKIYTGEDARKVVRSALGAEPAVPLQAIAAGASVPILVKNESELEAPAVILRLTEKEGAPNSSFEEGAEARLGSMAPGERRLVFLKVDPAPLAEKFVFSWELQDASKPVFVKSLKLDLAPEPSVKITVSPDAEAGLAVDYTQAKNAGLWIYHPQQITGTDRLDKVYSLADGSGRALVQLNKQKKAESNFWSIIPYEMRGRAMIFGKRLSGALSKTFPFQTAVRYFTQNGEQIGVGPLPPQVGEETSYWVVWSIGPTEAALQNVSLGTRLAKGVKATGAFASVVPGNFSVQGDNVSWAIPSLPVVDGEPETFAFEISFAPTSEFRGQTPMLIQESYATAFDQRSGSVMRAEYKALDTNLEFDAQAKGKGRVE